MNEKFYQIQVSWDEKLLKRRGGPQSVSITTRDFFSRYYPRLCEWRWKDYFSDRDGFYQRIPVPLTGKLWYKGPIDFMDACYNRKGMVACVSNKVKNIFHELKVDSGEFVLHPIEIQNEQDDFYVLFIPFLSNEELRIDYSRTLFNYAPWPDVLERYFSGEQELQEYLSDINNPLRTKRLVIDQSLGNRDIINAGYIHGDIYFSERIIQAFREREVIGYEVEDSPTACPLSFSDALA